MNYKTQLCPPESSWKAEKSTKASQVNIEEEEDIRGEEVETCLLPKVLQEYFFRKQYKLVCLEKSTQIRTDTSSRFRSANKIFTKTCFRKNSTRVLS